jgi:hypothetical protein
MLIPIEHGLIVTAFEFSAMSRCVKAWVGPVAEISDGPYAQYDRHIKVGLLRKDRSILFAGERWPCWIVVVAGDHSKAPFPRLPDDFDIWFDDWARTNNITVLQDWRAEARQDGCADDWTWKQAHKIAADLLDSMIEGGAHE